MGAADEEPRCSVDTKVDERLGVPGSKVRAALGVREFKKLARGIWPEALNALLIANPPCSDRFAFRLGRGATSRDGCDQRMERPARRC